jgi:hypothetical protein
MVSRNTNFVRTKIFIIYKDIFIFNNFLYLINEFSVKIKFFEQKYFIK